MDAWIEILNSASEAVSCSVAFFMDATCADAARLCQVLEEVHIYNAHRLFTLEVV